MIHSFSLSSLILILLLGISLESEAQNRLCPGGLDSIQQVAIQVDCKGDAVISWGEHPGKCYSLRVGSTYSILNTTGTEFHISSSSPGIASGTQFWINEYCGNSFDPCSPPSGGSAPVDVFSGILPNLNNSGTWNFSSTGEIGRTNDNSQGMNALDSASYFTEGSPTEIPSLLNISNFRINDSRVSSPTCSSGELSEDGTWSFNLAFEVLTLDSFRYQVFTGTTTTDSTMTSDGSITGGLITVDDQSIERFRISGLSANSYTVHIVGYSDHCTFETTFTTAINPGSDHPTLACSNKIYVSTKENCSSFLTSNMILLGNVNPCMLDLVDSLVLRHGHSGEVISSSNFQFSPVDTIFIEDVSPYIENELILEVHNIGENYNSTYCWGTVVFQDKLPPKLICDTLQVLPCLEFNGANTDGVTFMDCDQNSTTELVFQEIVVDCSVLPDSIVRRFIRGYKATDQFGNESDICFDTIDYRRADQNLTNGDLLDISGLTLPNNRVSIQNSVQDSTPIYCDLRFPFLDIDQDGIPDPADTATIDGVLLYGAGIPTIKYLSNGIEKEKQLYPSNFELNQEHVVDLFTNCQLTVFFDDRTLTTSDCKKKVTRTWRISEWVCNSETSFEFVQNLEVIDTMGPNFTLPASMKLSADQSGCSKLSQIPPLENLSDNCLSDEPIEVIVNAFNNGAIGSLSTESGTFDYVNGGNLNLEFGINIIEYIAIDPCHNQTKDTIEIEVVDGESPVVLCKEFVVVGINQDQTNQYGHVLVPTFAFDLGSYDDCALESTCVARMDDLNIFDSLYAEGVGGETEKNIPFVYLDSFIPKCNRQFDPSGTDSNGRDYLVRDDLCTEAISLCCDDAGSEQMVVFQVTDKAQNVNLCMATVTAQNKSAPSFTCPPDLTVDCQFSVPSTTDYAIFGTLAEQGQQQTLQIPSEYIIDSEGGLPIADGVIFSSCGDTVSVDENSTRSQCGIDTITRVFTVKNAFGEAKCTQTIIFSNQNVSNSHDVVWPADFDTAGCAVAALLVPELTGVPVFPEQNCTQIGYTYEDRVVLSNNQSENSCYKIIRNWSLIDWCKQPSFTIGTHTQNIQLFNTIDPVINNGNGCDTVTIDQPLCDSINVTLSMKASDDCDLGEDLSWEVYIDHGNDGSIDDTLVESSISIDNNGNESAVRANMIGQLGESRVVWQVYDNCRNSNSCESIVLIRNNNPPNPTCLSSIVASINRSNSNGDIVVWASEYDVDSVMNECGNALIYSFDSLQFEHGRTFTCNDYISFDSINETSRSQDLNIYVHSVQIDTVGNEIDTFLLSTSFCDVELILQDANNICRTNRTDNSTVDINGLIKSPLDNTLNNVSVSLNTINQGAALISTKTNETGEFRFSGMTQGKSYTIKPYHDKDVLHGISTLDLILIQKHILGLLPLENPYKLVAADVNNDGVISVIDILELRNVLLLNKPKFSNNTSYRFFNSEYVSDFNGNILNENIPESFSVEELSKSLRVEFIGLKIGDVNGTLDEHHADIYTRSSAKMMIQDAKFIKGNIVSVQITFGGAKEILGFQNALKFDPNILKFEGYGDNGIDLSTQNIGISEIGNGQIYTTWHTIKPKELNKDISYTLYFTARQNDKLSNVIQMSDHLNAELYSNYHSSKKLNLQFVEDENIDDSALVVFQNSPNPFADHTQIKYLLNSDYENVHVVITDINGKRLYDQKQNGIRGINSITIDRGKLKLTSGIYYYTISVSGQSITKEFIVI